MAGPKLPNYKYLHRGTRNDSVVVVVRDLLFRKFEWTVTRETYPDACASIFVGLPKYLVDNGTYETIKGELAHWMHGDIQEFFRRR